MIEQWSVSPDAYTYCFNGEEETFGQTIDSHRYYCQSGGLASFDWELLKKKRDDTHKKNEIKPLCSRHIQGQTIGKSSF